MLLPFAVAIVTSLLDGGHTAFADRALMELRIRDVGLHPVTIGLYSRDGWAHPGPFVYYLLAVPYRLLGLRHERADGRLADHQRRRGGGAWASIAKRVGGLGAALVVLVAASAVARALGMELLVDPWVCWITVLPFGVFCLLTWAMADGRIWALPGDRASSRRSSPRPTSGTRRSSLPALVVGTVWLVVRVRRHARTARGRWSDGARRPSAPSPSLGAAALGRVAGDRQPLDDRPLVPRHQGARAHPRARARASSAVSSRSCPTGSPAPAGSRSTARSPSSTRR